MSAKVLHYPTSTAQPAPRRHRSAERQRRATASAEVVQLERYLRQLQLSEALGDVNEQFAAREIPSPAEFGWRPSYAEDGTIDRWFHPRYRALIGVVPGTPDRVYLDRNHLCRAWEMTLEELALGLETGTLPEPLSEVRIE